MRTDLLPFTCVVDGEMFLTYAPDEGAARAVFEVEGLPDDVRVRQQPQREADAFVYTHPERGNVCATLCGQAASADEDPHEAPTVELSRDELDL